MLGFHSAAEALVIEFDFLVFFFELLLEALDVSLELLFALLVLALEGKDLVVELAGLAGIVVSLLVGGPRRVAKDLDGLLHLTDALLGEDDLVSH